MASLWSFIDQWLVNPKWRTVRRLGDLRILGISFASFIFITLIARGISYARAWLEGLGVTVGQIEPDLGEWVTTVSDQLTLPFGLKLLAYSAVFAVIGKVIYESACPPYIKVGDSFQHFTSTYSGALSRLCDDFVKLWNISAPSVRQKIRQDAQASHLVSITFIVGRDTVEDVDPLSSDTVTRFTYAHPHPGASRGGFPTKEFRYLLRDGDFGAAIYDALREHRDASRIVLRIICAVSYYVALGFAGYAVIYQAWWALPAFTSY